MRAHPAVGRGVLRGAPWRPSGIVLGLALPLCLLLSGCPRDLETPPRGDGQECDTLADCNPDAACGLLTACVDERCEAQPSVIVPCPDAAPVFIRHDGGM